MMVWLVRFVVAIATFFISTLLSMRGFQKYEDGRSSPYAARVSVFFGLTSAALALHPAPLPWKAKDRTRRPLPIFMYALSFFANWLISLLIVYTGDPAYAIISIFFTTYVTAENGSRGPSEIICVVPFFLALATVLLFSDSEPAEYIPDTMAGWFDFDLVPATYVQSFMTGDDTFFVNAYLTRRARTDFLLRYSVLRAQPVHHK